MKIKEDLYVDLSHGYRILRWKIIDEKKISLKVIAANTIEMDKLLWI